MRKLIFLLLLILSSLHLSGQPTSKELKGEITFLTSQNIYARFTSTEGIEKGDTVFLIKDDILVPAFTADYISSTSCAGRPIGKNELKKDDLLVLFAHIIDNKLSGGEKDMISPLHTTQLDSAQNKDDKILKRKQKIDGRFSVLSYQSYSNTPVSDFQRMRYTLSFKGKYLAGSPVSVESYISFAHKINEWSYIQNDIFNGLKIYNLAANYEFSKKTNIWLGRKINPGISSMGAIDGLQAETGFKKLFAGAVLGFRPDYIDYGFNSSLLEYGAYIGHNYLSEKGNMMTTMAFFQQTNNGEIDRRFAYFQFDNSLIKNLNLFLSGEVDLYRVENGIPGTTLSLTSFFISMRYRIYKNLSLFVSYDTRKNVIYYETDKNYLDQLLEDATRQGVQLRVNFRPIKMLSIGINGGYRHREGDFRPTKNVNSFVSFYQIPWIESTGTVSASWLSTSFLDGYILGIRLSKELLSNKISGDFNLRYADYNFSNNVNQTRQFIGEIGLMWRILPRISLSVDYEGTLENSSLYNRIYLNFTWHF